MCFFLPGAAAQPVAYSTRFLRSVVPRPMCICERSMMRGVWMCGLYVRVHACVPNFS